jgi:hypothetical protein
MPDDSTIVNSDDDASELKPGPWSTPGSATILFAADGGGGGLVIPGVCISPAKADVESRSDSPSTATRGRKVFMVSCPLWEQTKLLGSLEFVERAHNSTSRKLSY